MNNILNYMVVEKLANNKLFQRDLEIFFDSIIQAEIYAKENHFSGVYIK